MSTVKTFTTKPQDINASSFYPRNYDPIFIFVKNILKEFSDLENFVVEPIKGGSTPPAYFFYNNKDEGIPFVKTSAILRHFINMNDLHFINENFHNTTIKRSKTKPYDVIFSMTGKFMGKAALCPPTIEEINMSQNSIVLKTGSPLKSAFLTIFLNSTINQIQIKGNYSITKQKYLNQGKIEKLKILSYNKKYDSLLEDYINGINNYYTAIEKIQNIIATFNNTMMRIDKNFLDVPYSFASKPDIINSKILLPSNYRKDYDIAINEFYKKFDHHYLLKEDNISRGDEIGSDNYLFEGLPFIKTSDITNFDVDYEPNYYCSEAMFNEVQQEIRTGDIIFTKDGKRGEVAIIQENANILISSGFIKYKPKNSIERYWLFLLLSSNLGKIFFDKWFVIASTMAHLRKDFFSDFKVPECSETIKSQYINPLEKAFKLKDKGFNELFNSKSKILSELYQDYNIEK